MKIVFYDVRFTYKKYLVMNHLSLSCVKIKSVLKTSDLNFLSLFVLRWINNITHLDKIYRLKFFLLLLFLALISTNKIPPLLWIHFFEFQSQVKYLFIYLRLGTSKNLVHPIVNIIHKRLSLYMFISYHVSKHFITCLNPFTMLVNIWLFV